jgi:hypothetical protein
MQTTVRRDIGLELTREQYGLIVEGLAERPFRQVFELIGQLHAGACAGGASVRFTVSPAQLRLILDTLGGMPFARVSRLLQSMQRQMLMDKH